MKITNYLNTSEEEVFSKKYNTWIGISLGNKYFTPEHLKDYITSCLVISRSGVLVIIADDPHAINYEVFDNKTLESALIKARRKGGEIFTTVLKVINEFSTEEQDKIALIRWQDISQCDWYQERLHIFRQAFQIDKKFKEQLVQIVQMNMGNRLDKLELPQIEKLAEYVLEELPIFIGALLYKETEYDLHLYPGLNLLDNLIINIQNGSAFPELRQKITIRKDLAIIEAYAE